MKLTKVKLYTAFLGAVLTLSSCEKDYLEVLPSNAVSYEQAFSSPVAVDAAMTGIYRLMREAPVNQGTVSHDSYGVHAIYLTYEVMGQDIMANSNWFQFQYVLDNKAATYRGTRVMWGLSYNIIANANNIIANVGSVPNIADEDAKAFEAEAKALRAYSYFNLARIYQHTYLKDKNALSVPLMLDATTPQTTGKGRATLEQLYAQIVSDLTFASENIDVTRAAKSRINKNVVDGLLARVYLEMGEWEKAANHAVLARAGYPLMTASQYKAGFNSFTNGEWIWGLPQSADQNPIYPSFFSFIDGRYTVDSKGARAYVRRGYNNIRANDKFVELFDAADARREFQEDPTAFVLKDGNKVWNSDRYNITKFKDEADMGGDLVMMRSAEMMLIEAEAKARLGNSGDAQELVYQLRLQRFTNPDNIVRPTSTGDALIDEIWVERRKELYGEGFGLFDIKRLQKPLVREGNHTAFLGITPANSNLFIYQIPQVEMDNNPELKGQQNP